VIGHGRSRRFACCRERIGQGHEDAVVRLQPCLDARGQPPSDYVSNLWRVVRHTVPAPDTIELWFGSTSSLGDLDAVDNLWPLSVDERERAARFRFEQDRRAFVLGKRMVRMLLGRALDRPPESVAVAVGPAGKPQLAEGDVGSGLTFNVAHSGTEVVCAIASGRPVGVDIERERDILDLQGLAQRFFCAAEIRELDASTPARARRLFFKYWTLKEAYLKAEGSGLRLDLTAVDASGFPDAATSPCLPVEDRRRGLLVFPVEAPFGYQAAVASSFPPWTTTRYIWPAAERVEPSRSIG
jgi:4'-phosphopantetheinyl transferase